MNGLPFAPQLTTVPIPVPRGGTELHIGNGERFRLWSDDCKSGEPAVVQGSDLDMVYHQACIVAAEEAEGGTLIVDLDLPPDAKVRLPVGYPLPEGMTPEERDQWFGELVSWWQEKRSNLEQRIPYIHGNRLHRFGGVDQVERIKAMLKQKGSSRILATLIDPARDFRDGGREERFASFCLVQFRLRDETKTSLVDVVGYYRAQEFARWWPINVAELRALQVHVLKGTQLRPGRITTITAEARTIGRSPTQVAMPVIDRWLDQHPERLHVLANRLIGHACDEGLDRLIQREWFQTLDDLESAAAAYNEDGVPIPIDGLEALASYLHASKPTGEVKAFLTQLRALIKTNRAYETSSQTETDFENWGARDLVPDLRASSEALFGIMSPLGRP